MSGLFGGIYGLLNITGGFILFVLFGSCAWNKNANFIRVILGSSVFGSLIGYIMYYIKGDHTIGYYIFAALLIAVAFSFIISALKYNIEN